jgi:hypothetical protein
LALHLFAVAKMAHDRFGLPFNAAPGAAPAFANPARDTSPARWNRLAVARWDAEHYVGLALRGYSPCPRGDLRRADLSQVAKTCDIRFYPGYALLGYLASLGGRLPVDYALLGVSLVASLVFLFLWTGPALVTTLGPRTTYLALLAFNAYPTGFALVTVQTEPVALALTLGAFVALFHRRLILGAVLAGATSAVRGPGLATAAAYALAIVVIAMRERPEGARAWSRHALAVLLCGWGLAALMGTHLVLFHDPLLIVRAYSATLGAPSAEALFPPSVDTILRSIDWPAHEGVWVLLALLWLALGHREAMRGFAAHGRAYFSALAALALLLALYGSAPVKFTSMTRYTLLALPVFFAIGAATRKRPLAIMAWLLMCGWHYWQVDLCLFVGDRGDRTLRACHAEHWIGRL